MCACVCTVLEGECVVFSRGLLGFSGASCHYFPCLSVCAQFDPCVVQASPFMFVCGCVRVCVLFRVQRPDAMYRCADEQ